MEKPVVKSMMTDPIDWKRVNEKLRCPLCGDKAHIEAGTDGTRGYHAHSFELTRTEAMRLSRPTAEEIRERIARLETELSQLKSIELK